MSFETLPCRAAVHALEKPTARAAAVQAVRRAVDLPHRGKKHIGVVGIKNNFNAAGFGIAIQHLLPALAAVTAAEDAALGVLSVGVPQRSDEYHIRIIGI